MTNEFSTMPRTAILLTCFNRKDQTLKCLGSIFNQDQQILSDIYLVDDGSTDGTLEAVKAAFPMVNIILGNGNLFWAGGMRKAWQSAIDSGITYDYFCLLNDDTLLYPDAFKKIWDDIRFLNTPLFILVGATMDVELNVISYGGRFLTNRLNGHSRMLVPNNKNPQLCHLGNANIMLVPYGVYQKLGILSSDYTHGIADFDYTLRAKKAGIPSYVASYILGTCQDNHGKNWGSNLGLKARIKYLYNVKGLSYKEYMRYVRSHFPFSYPKTWVMLWAKTFFPFIWDRYKADK